VNADDDRKFNNVSPNGMPEFNNTSMKRQKSMKKEEADDIDRRNSVT
jgi:hypothetical protein